MSRNPSLSKQLFGYAILGFALSEAMALFALMVAFFILFSDGVHPLLSMPMPSLGCQSSGDLAIGGGMECVRDW